MSEIKSNIIKVYPAVGRNHIYSNSAYLNTEANLTNILKSLYHNNDCSFVISETFSAPFKFVLFGYYFEISDISSFNDKKNLWARIYINNSDVKQKLSSFDSNYTDLDTDASEDSIFRGVIFYNSESKSTDIKTGYITYDLKLTDSSGNIVLKSKLHYDTTQLQNSDDGSNLIDKLTTKYITSTSASITNGCIDNITTKDITITTSLKLPKQIGSSTNPTYVDSTGHFVGSTSSVGSSSKPVYLNKGNISEISTISLNGDNYLEKLNSTSITTSSLNSTSITTSSITTSSITTSSITTSSLNVTDEAKVKSITASAVSINADITFPKPLGSSIKPIYIDSARKLAESTNNIGSASKPIYMNNGELKEITNLALTGNSSLGTLNNTQISNTCNVYIGSNSNYAVYTTTDGKLITGSLSVSEPTASAQALSMVNNTCSFSYVDTNSQDGKGKISTTKKYITITYGSIVDTITSTNNRNYLEIK